MSDLPASFLDAIDSAFSVIRDQIELNEVMVEGELAIIKEGRHPEAVLAPASDEGTDDLIDALRNHAAVEWQEVHSTIEMALIRGRAEGASWAMSMVAERIGEWAAQPDI